METHDPVHGCRQSLIVSSDQSGASLSSHELKKLRKNLVGSRFVKIPGGLVRQDQARSVCQRTGNRDALLLAARKFARSMFEPFTQTERAKQFLRPVLALDTRPASDELRKDHILNGVEVRKQMMELVNEANVISPDRRPLIFPKPRRIDAGDLD